MTVRGELAAARPEDSLERWRTAALSLESEVARVVIGQPGGLGLRSVGAAAHTEVADSIAAPAPVAEPAPAAAKPPELAQPAAPAQPARATARHHR